MITFKTLQNSFSGSELNDNITGSKQRGSGLAISRIRILSGNEFQLKPEIGSKWKKIINKKKQRW